MSSLEEYEGKYSHIHFERRDGILQMTLHTDHDAVKFNGQVHTELGLAFADLARDPDNRLIIMTGSGASFLSEVDWGSLPPPTPATWDHVYSAGKRLLMDLLDIDVPMIAAINGPATIHAELALLCDIVLATEDTVFQDAPHFCNGVVPGDGVHVVWPLLLGPNRGRYFLLTGQTLSAKEALDLGVVSEVLSRDRLLARAWELAAQITKQSRLTCRYARVAMTQHLKKRLLEELGYGLMLEGMAGSDSWPTKGPSKV